MFKDTSTASGGGRYKCLLCDRMVRDRCDARRHLEAKHFPNLSSYKCNICDKPFRSLNALKSHKNKQHKDSKSVKSKSASTSGVMSSQNEPDYSEDEELNVEFVIKEEIL